jgi:hypothetical protein
VRALIGLASVAVLLILPARSVGSDVRAARPAARKDVPWVVGERLEYRVKFGLFNVGHAALEVLDVDTIRGEPCYHVVFTTHGHALVYSLQDSLQSWFGVNDFSSRRFNQNANENGHPRIRHYEIFPGTIWIKNDADTGQTVSQPLDDASFFYFARTLALDDGQSYVIPRYFQAEHNPVTIRVVGRENTSVPAGRFPSVVVQPVFQSGGMFSKNGEAMIWFSDDDERLPLRIRATMSLGTLDISLTGITRP